jgi:hypothetical protein
MLDRLASWFEGLRRPRPASSVRALLRYEPAAETLSVEALFGRFVDFYREQPFGGLDPADDADMLLFQFGCYDWGDGERFEVSLTRQFAHRGSEGELSQLHADFYFEPEPDLRALGADDKWCQSPAQASALLADILAGPAVAAVRALQPVRREISWERV